MIGALPLLRAFGRQRVLQRGKLRLLHLIAGPEKMPPERFEVDFFGYRYSGDLSNYIDWMVYMTGAYEPGILKLLSDLAQQLRARGRPVHYVDVGANVGHHALYMSRYADQVTAFEPFPRVAEEIRWKIEANWLANLRLFPVALGDADAEMALQLDDPSNLGTASLDPNRSRHPVPVGMVSVRHGDRLFESESLPPIDILKIDVEGFESAVFRGLRDRITRDRPVILTEITERDFSGFGSPEDFCAALYPEHEIFSVRATRDGGYQLLPTELPSPEVLCVPREFAAAVRGTQ